MSRQEKLADLLLGFPADLKHEQKRFIRIPSLNVPEMRPLGTFYSVSSNGYHGHDDNFGYVFPSSITLQSIITIKWQGKKLSVITTFTHFLFLTILRLIE